MHEIKLIWNIKYIRYMLINSQTWKDRFWAESVINFRCQKGNKFYTESIISDDVGKSLLEIWQNLLIGNRNQTESVVRLWWQTGGRNRAESVLSLLPRLPLGSIYWYPFLVFKICRGYNWNLSILWNWDMS